MNFDMSISENIKTFKKQLPESVTLVAVSKTKPVAAAAMPEYELSNDMTTGISAPPMGMTESTPSNNPTPKIT